MKGRPATTLLTVFLLFGVAQKTRRSPSDATKLGEVCVDGGYLRFDPEPPKRNSGLTMCHTYSDRTCCNETHTNKIRVQAAGYYQDEELAADCRTIAVELHCSMCDPRIGTGKFPGVCNDYCSKAYSKCKEAYFELYDGRLRACLSSSLLCSPLHTIVTEHLLLHHAEDDADDKPSPGETFCDLAGLRTTASPPCYDGSVPPSSPRRSSKKSSKDSGWFPSLIDIEIALSRGLRDFTRMPGWKQAGYVFLSLVAAWSLATLVQLCVDKTVGVFTGEGGDSAARRAEKDAQLARSAKLDKELSAMDNFMIPQMDQEVD